MPRLSKQEKQEEVRKLADQLKEASAIIFTLYRGLTVREIAALRNDLKGQGIAFKVVKTSLLKRALSQEKLPLPEEEVFSQPLAVAFSKNEEITPAKILDKAALSTGKLAMLSGIVNGTLVGADSLKALASLPGRDELYARLTGTLSFLPRRLIYALGYPASSLSRLLKQYQEKGV